MDPIEHYEREIIYLCQTGRRLQQEWSEAIEHYVSKETIYSFTQAYFHHKNTCPDCCSPELLDQNRQTTPSLFGKTANPEY